MRMVILGSKVVELFMFGVGCAGVYFAFLGIGVSGASETGKGTWVGRPVYVESPSEEDLSLQILE